MTNVAVNGSNQLVLSPDPLTGCVLWNKLGSDAEVAASEIGPNGAITGAPGYAAGKYGNALDSDANNYVKFTDAHPTGVSYAGFWWKPDNGSAVASVASPYYAEGTPATDGIVMFITNNTPAYTLALLVYTGGVLRIQYRYNTAFTAGTWYHMMIKCNGGGAANNRMFLFMDGVQLVPSAYTNDNAFALGGLLDTYIGRPAPTMWGAQSLVDNVKIFDSTGTQADILANRSIEGWLYEATGTYDTPAIDAGAAKRIFAVGWGREEYTDDEALSSVQIRGTDVAPTGAATGQGTDDDGTAHDYWSAPVWSPGAWETVAQDVPPALASRYVQVRLNLAASTDLGDSPIVNSLMELFRASAYSGNAVSVKPGGRRKVLHLDALGQDLAGGTVTLDFPVLEAKIGRGGAGLDIADATFKLDNTSGAFNVGNPQAWLAGQQVFGAAVTAWAEFFFSTEESRRFDLWAGVGESLDEDETNKTVSLRAVGSRETFALARFAGNDNDVTPAAVLQTALEGLGWVAGVDFDAASFLRSAFVQGQAGIRINYNWNADPISFPELARRLALLGCADVFFWKGKLYYQAWSPVILGATADLTWFEDAPKVTRPVAEMYNDYAITPDGGAEQTDAANNNIGVGGRAWFGTRTLQLGDDDTAAMTSAAAAVALGEQYIKRDLPRSYQGILRPLSVVTCGVDLLYLDRINLGDHVRMTWPRSGYDLTVMHVEGIRADVRNETLTLTLREAATE